MGGAELQEDRRNLLTGRTPGSMEVGNEVGVGSKEGPEVEWGLDVCRHYGNLCHD